MGNDMDELAEALDATAEALGYPSNGTALAVDPEEMAMLARAIATEIACGG